MSVAASTQSKSAITLKGSSEIVAEFFNYGVNSILYQRGIFPPESFVRVQKYGLTLLVSTNEEIKTYLSNIINQIQEWLTKKIVQKLVVVINSVDTGEVLERWDFNIEYENCISDKGDLKPKDINDINKEISAVIRQITASITFLPLLDCPCAFDLHIYTDKNLDITSEWSDTAPSLISNSLEVKLRSFSTSVHKVDAVVSYKNVD